MKFIKWVRFSKSESVLGPDAIIPHFSRFSGSGPVCQIGYTMVICEAM